MNIRNIKTKKPWRIVLASGGRPRGVYTAGMLPDTIEDNPLFTVKTQADFLREYYPSGHAINDPQVYPDIYRSQEEPVLDAQGEPTGRTKTMYYKEEVPRYAFAFQQIIAAKQVVHLCGNDIQFEMAEDNADAAEAAVFSEFKRGWASKDMEIAFYDMAKSAKVTGDGAMAGYLKNGSFGFKSLSYLNGDTLYPHYDPVTGDMVLFARSHYGYDTEGNVSAEWVEVWDNTYLYKYKSDKAGISGMANRILEVFGLDGYRLVSKEPHGFPFIPVAYKRDESGACWSSSQDSCDGYEMSFSQMAQNNQAFGFPIMYLQGTGADSMAMQHDMNGSIKIITGGEDSKASFLSSPDASESFVKQLDTLYKMIYEQSFAVIPPSLKSGDLPAAALKILYSPAYEKAMADAAEYQEVLNQMVRIFRFGYGVEKEMTLDFSLLPLTWWIKPYVHVNESTLVADLASAVQNGFVSRQTASERVQMYSTPSEWERIMREVKEEQQADLLTQLNDGTAG